MALSFAGRSVDTLQPMGKAWQPAGYQPLPTGDDPSVNGKASDSSAKAGTSFLPSFEPAVLQSVDSTLRFTPSSTLGPTRKWLHIDDKGEAKLIEVRYLEEAPTCLCSAAEAPMVG